MAVMRRPNPDHLASAGTVADHSHLRVLCVSLGWCCVGHTLPLRCLFHAAQPFTLPVEADFLDELPGKRSSSAQRRLSRGGKG